MDGEENNQQVIEEKIETAQETPPQAETKPEAVAAQEEAVASEEPEAQAQPQTEQEVADWREKQINKQHARLKESKRLIEERDRQIADLQAMLERRGAPESTTQAQPELPKPPARQQPDPEAIRSQVELELRLEQIGKAGETAYGDKWNKSLERLVQIAGEGGIQDLPWMARALDDPAKVLHKLGSNPAEAMRIMELPPERRQAEYFKLAIEQAPKPPKPSAAPAPVDALKPRSQPVNELSDTMSDEDWHAMRKAQRDARFVQRGGRR